MTILLDTNVFLWSIGGYVSKISAAAKRVLEDDENDLVLSAVSLWEIALKSRAGKLGVPENHEFFRDHMRRLGVEKVLPVYASHVFEMFNLADHHRDPFDRLLVAQSRHEGYPIVSSDSMLRKYPIEVIW